MIITALYLSLVSCSGLTPPSDSPEKEIIFPFLRADTIKIGLLIQDTKSTAAVHGAEMAADKANLSGLHPEKFFSIEVRNMEGPWGTGAKETVSLVFTEDVQAVIGSVDGRNSHLAEQVSAKTHVPYISALSGDPTLAQAFIPWYFSCVPGDLQQADCILHYIRSKEKTRIMILSGNEYDPKMASTSFIKKAKINGFHEPECYFGDLSNPDIMQKIKNLEPDCIIVFGTRDKAIELISVIAGTNINVEIFSPLLPYAEMEFSDAELKKLEGVILISPEYLFNMAGKSFTSRYEKKFMKKPGPAAAYAYDAVNVIIEGIRKAGDDRMALKDCISELKLEGLTGIISFDRNGNRREKPSLMKIKEGQLVQIW